MVDKIMIGSRIRTVRESMPMTREQFAELINVSVSFLSQIERGNKLMSIEKLMEISTKTGFSTDYILFGDKAKSNYVSRISRMLQDCSNDVAEVAYEVLCPLMRYNEK